MAEFMDVERAFHAAVIDTRDRAKREAGYSPTRLKPMFAQPGGFEVASGLLATSRPPAGLQAMPHAAFPDLSVESHVVDPRLSTLLSDTQVGPAVRHLREVEA